MEITEDRLKYDPRPCSSAYLFFKLQWPGFLKCRVKYAKLLKNVEVRVNFKTWTRLDNLDLAKPNDKVFTVCQDEDDNMYIKFGDGKHGSRLPSGIVNIKCTYRNKGESDDDQNNIHSIAAILKPPCLGIERIYTPYPASGGENSD
jgi:hypothetical protein